MQNKVDRLRGKLASRGRIEKALFDEGPMTLVMLLIPAIVLTVELTANVARGSGWTSTAHFVVMVPLVFVLYWYIGLGLRSTLFQMQLARAERVHALLASDASPR